MVSEKEWKRGKRSAKVKKRGEVSALVGYRMSAIVSE
jgi:hypothetical protein